MQRLTVQVVPSGLEHRIAVPIQAKPMQIVHHQFGRAGHHARFVDVFDAQQHVRRPRLRADSHAPSIA